MSKKTDSRGNTAYTKRVIEIAVQKYLKGSALSPRTRELYRHYILMFVDWACKNKIAPEEADLVTVAEWFDEHPTWSASTRHTAAAVLREFYRFQFGDAHPLTQVKVKRVDPGPQRTLDESELATLLGSIDTTSEQGIRDMAIVTLMVDTGLRANEICNIELRRLDVRNKRLSVQIKGGNIGEAVFFEYTAHCLMNWLSVRPFFADPENEFLFCSIKGKTPGHQMTRYGIRMILNTLSRKAELDLVSPHAMRRTFATLATEHGAPTRLVQVAGRWKSIRMVETYTQRVKPQKIAPFSPVNHVMGIETEGED